MAKRINKNILVLESAWENYTLEPKRSVKTLIDYIAITKEIKYSYNYMNTIGELEYTLDNIPVSKFAFLYMAFHGKPNYIQLGLQSEFRISLTDLAEIMGSRFAGYAIHFASCAVLNIDKEALSTFKEQTGAAFVSGYSEYVFFDESSIMDMALIHRWTSARNYKRMFENMSKSYKSLITANGFKYYI